MRVAVAEVGARSKVIVTADISWTEALFRAPVSSGYEACAQDERMDAYRLKTRYRIWSEKVIDKPLGRSVRQSSSEGPIRSDRNGQRVDWRLRLSLNIMVLFIDSRMSNV